MPYFSYLQHIVKDDYLLCSMELRNLLEKYHKMELVARTQLMVFMDHLIGIDATEMDILCIILLKNIQGADLSRNNLWLINAMLVLFESHREWLSPRRAVVQGFSVALVFHAVFIIPPTHR
eukprot:TRINITY_DN20586_c0_g1_i1.p1 TRINITY_DN20586_c0_g1~~TRINITY_DN20586_c0_g1_i1.p1  ORF type:complete len:121 (-),score=8.76 TRINITY_DN20586_c0_g1_i1:329-691(-)